MITGSAHTTDVDWWQKQAAKVPDSEDISANFMHRPLETSDLSSRVVNNHDSFNNLAYSWAKRERKGMGLWGSILSEVLSGIVLSQSAPLQRRDPWANWTRSLSNHPPSAAGETPPVDTEVPYSDRRKDLVARFEGRVLRTQDGIVFIELTDSAGRKTHIQCAEAQLKIDRLGNRGSFYYDIYQSDAGAWECEMVPRDDCSIQDHWAMREAAEDALGNANWEDDD